MSEQEKAEAAPAPKKKSGKLIVVGGVVAVLVLGGGGAFWWFTRSAHAATPDAAAKKSPEEGGVVPLEPFLVNLADTGGSRYLRTTLKLVVADEKTAEKLTKNEVALMRVRSSILELLTTETADHLVTADGKAALKKSIGQRISPIVGTEISDVLFVDFVVQF